MKAKEESDKLKGQAKEILLRLFHVPEGYSSGLIERFVDCVIMAAVLEVAALQEEAKQKELG